MLKNPRSGTQYRAKQAVSIQKGGEGAGSVACGSPAFGALAVRVCSRVEKTVLTKHVSEDLSHTLEMI